ncbi:hypothetical protein [Chelativorans sp. AA-79]|uniref:hypothetical protein n=1 Tax=Chelativorans sp. AA-79 TaxID=3028735 RepID=UPI0023F88D65|nr:hypothetical protein [Chelativorans sp. AA-79]WEX11458.1 hypothetical protein PVE73_11250 [Chelativorans sp. AA-79]
MFHLAALHQLGVARGDGLRPEFLELARRQSERGHPAVTEIYGNRQAGPDPAPRLDGMLPENVVLFPQAASEMPKKSVITK